MLIWHKETINIPCNKRNGGQSCFGTSGSNSAESTVCIERISQQEGMMRKACDLTRFLETYCAIEHAELSGYL